MVSSTHAWLSLWLPKSLPSVTTSFARAISASLLRIHQKTPAPMTPTTSKTMTTTTMSRALSQPGIGTSDHVEQIGNLRSQVNNLRYVYFKCLSNQSSTVLCQKAEFAGLLTQ